MDNSDQDNITSILYAQRIVDIDWYLCEPLKNYDPSYCYLSNTSIKRVPVIRIFGPTPTGQSTCLHIHGVFPYLYIPLPAGVDPSPNWIGELSKSINSAITKRLTFSNSTLHHVYDIKIVAAKPFYGYHPTKRIFLQIFLYDPLHIRMLADILLTGTVMNIPLQPHEAHIPFQLQFMIDYNLYGMSLIYLDELQFRFSPDDAEELLYSPSDNHTSTFSTRIWTLSSLPQELLHAESRHSNCDLEVDTQYHSILNPSLFSTSENPGLAVLWEDERQRRIQEGLSPDITLPLEIERNLEYSAREEQFLAQFEAVLHQKKESVREGDSVLPICSLSTSQRPEKEDANTSLLLSHPNLMAAGETDIISLLTELDMGTQSEKGRQLNIDGRLIVVPSLLVSSASESMDNESLSKSIHSGLELNLSIPTIINATNSFNLALIKDSIVAASILLLPPELQGNILSDETSLEEGINSSLLENMIVESYHLSQPFALNLEEATTQDQPVFTPPSQLDGSGSRGRKKSQKITNSKYLASRPKCVSPTTSTQKDYLGSVNSSPSSLELSGTNEQHNSPLKVSIPRISLDFKYNMPSNLPNRKRLVLNITRLDIGNPSYGLNLSNIIPEDNCIPSIPQVISQEPNSIDRMIVSESLSEGLISLVKSSHCVSEVPTTSPSILVSIPLESENSQFMVGVSASEQIPSVYSTPPIDVLQSPLGINQVKQEEVNVDQLPEFTTSDSCLNEDAKVEILSNTTIHVNTNYPDTSNPHIAMSNSPEKLLIENQVIDGMLDISEENCSHPNSLVSSDELSNDYMSPIGKFSEVDVPEISNSPQFIDTSSEVNNIPEVPMNIQLIQSQSMSSPTGDLPKGCPANANVIQFPENECSREITDQLHFTDMGNSNSNTAPSETNQVLDMLDPTSNQLTTQKQVSPNNKQTLLETDDYQLSVSPISENSECLAAYQASHSNSLPNSPPSSSGLLSSQSTLSPSNSRANGSPADVIPENNGIASKPSHRYSSVSSESESDNFEYQLSNSLLSKQPNFDMPLKQSSIDKEISLTKEIEMPFPERKAHSTPLINRSSKLSHNNIISEEKYSPILDEQISQSSYIAQSVPKGVLNIPPLITPGLSVQMNNFDNIVPWTQDNSQHLLKTSLQNSKDNFAYEFLISSQIQIEPNLSYYSQIEGPTLANLYNFKLNSQEMRYITTTETRVCQFLTVMSVEILVRTRCELSPDPQYDSLLAICYYVSTHEYHSKEVIYISGIISLSDTWDIEDLRKSDSLALTNLDDIVMTYAITEIDLFQEFISKVLEFDPDICLGFEYQRLSWGYLIERACILDIDLPFCLSRAQPPGRNPRDNLGEKPYSYNYSDPHIVGRILLNLWRICKHELTLTSYTFENVAYHTLHQRYTHFSDDILTKWYTVFPSRNRWRTLQYYMLRAKANIHIVETLDIVGRTSELARLFGIEFYNVLARGTQYRVESMMIRLLKRHEYITVSPSIRQRSKMIAPSAIPLVMEPRSTYFTDPVVVLDFQALYPSIIIAHNYCYSTCLGKLDYLSKDGLFPFGTIELEIPAHILGNLKSSDVTISPNGVVFVKPHIRKGMLPIMLEEIIKTRIMVKEALKKHKHDVFTEKTLNARQLGLKNIANVTFGYTQANFSGRMPCVDLGDSIVAKARETLEKSIDFVNNSPDWNGEVIYGDTDSLFILLPGTSRGQSFKIAHEIIKRITQMNPEPIKLKFEKIYQPCLLMAKKRYAGFSYETSDQTEPKFDAKGIETVRRDTCPIVAKILEHSLKLFFRTNEIDKVRKFVLDQCAKLFTENVSLQDLTFAREFRGLYGYQPDITTPSLQITKIKMCKDPRSEPRVGSRVPFVCVYSNPDCLLIDLIRTPEQVLADSSLHIHAHYYLYTHIIPSLQRAFDRAGANVHSWICALPRLFRPSHYDVLNPIEKRGLSNFIDTRFCAICDETGYTGLCPQCATDPERKHTLIGKRFQVANQSLDTIISLCKSCQGDSWAKDCVSTDCPVLYKRSRLTDELNYAKRLSDLYLSHYFDLSF